MRQHTSTNLSTPVQNRRNSLSGLPQYNENQYGRGKRRTAAQDAHNALEHDSEHDLFEPGGAKATTDIETEWFSPAIEFAMPAIAEDEPQAAEAINGIESEQWKEAMEAEIAQIEHLGTWEIVEALPNANIVPCCWVFRHKRGADGSIVRYKARLVAKGFKQQFGVDYTDMFTPTVRPSTLRTLLSAAASRGDVIVQADAKNAYLNAWLKDDEVIYMTLPDFYDQFRQLPANLAEKARNRKVVVRLLRPLYGTKQGAHHWYEELRRILESLKFKVHRR
jgi:hypothetical protein